ncbi:uncharacterized protein [Acropora muricata]|uniref:uncharacterized protein isoform X2 n=1 Tax=Acropora muricata TaxID=159855 RepID=UPI0034E465F1
MIEKLLRMFSRRKSKDASYVPLLLRYSETAKPLSLIIKRKRSIWKRPFAKDEMIFLAGLENSVCELDCAVSPMQFPEGLKSKLFDKYKKSSTPPGVAKRDSWGPILFKYCRVQYNKATTKLELMKGKFVGKYKITRAMSLVKDRKYDVVFNYDDDDDGDVDNDDPVDVVADNIFAVKPTRHVSLAKDLKCEDGSSNTDNDDGDNDDEKALKPLRFDKHLKHDTFNGDDDDCGDEHNNNDDVDGDGGRIPVHVVADDILPEDFNYRDMKNIEHIYKNVLLSTKSREQQKALVKKYLGWFENLLTDDKKKILLDEPLTRSDCAFLRSFYGAALPD